jgi:short-subunit dehydrogenase
MTGVDGKVCVVTGASSGIGEATSKALARAGAQVVLAARREDRLAALGQAIRSRGGRATWVRCDVTSILDAAAVRDHVLTEHGRCDVLINNAGVPGGGRFADLTLEQIETVTATNYLGVMYCTNLLLPDLLESRGHVINVASVAGRNALPGAAAYTAAKHAVVALSEALYYELKESGVMVTSINPGLVGTEGFPMTELKRDPLARNFIMRPERVARVIVDVIRKRRGPEVSVPRWLGSLQALRVLAPPLYRAAMARLVGGRAQTEAAPPA